MRQRHHAAPPYPVVCELEEATGGDGGGFRCTIRHGQILNGVETRGLHRPGLDCVVHEPVFEVWVYH